MKFNFFHKIFFIREPHNLLLYKHFAIFGMIGFSYLYQNKVYNKNVAYTLNTQETNFNKPVKLDKDTINKNLNSELNFHIRNFEHYLEKSLKHEKVKFTLVKDYITERPKLKHTLNFYHFDKTIKKLWKEIRKIDKILRNCLNVLDNNFTIGIIQSNFDFNEIVAQIKKLHEIKNNSFLSDDEKTKNNKGVLENYLFIFHELLLLRLFSAMIVIHKNNLNSDNKKNILTKENIEFILNYSKKMLIKELKNEDVNESIVYFVKRIFINYFSNKDYYYSDYLLELNKAKNFEKFFEFEKIQGENQIEVDEDKNFDFDIVFISGLNSEFSKTWRVPKSNDSASFVDYLQFLLYGINIEKVYSTPSYELWIPKMFEGKTFREKNIRYLVTNVETKIFPHQLKDFNIPDYTIDEIADKILSALRAAGVGKRPFLIVSHSMGGLICKKFLSRNEQNQKLSDNKNLKGVVFFSTPHFGSNIFYNIVDIAISKYFKFFQVFHTTSSEFGLHEEDIKSTVIDFKYTNATNEICFQSRKEFEKEHQSFTKTGIDYICINETHKTYIKEIGERVHIVDPESCYLPETKNYFLKNKIHSDVQKFSPENFDEEGYKILTRFIEDSLFKENGDLSNNKF